MDELISRRALQRKLYDDYHGAISDSELKVYQVIRLLEEAPTVAAEPVRHAAWEHRNNSATCKRIGDFEEWLECSACNAEVDRKYPNCPYCTARMDLDPATEKEDSR